MGNRGDEPEAEVDRRCISVLVADPALAMVGGARLAWDRNAEAERSLGGAERVYSLRGAGVSAALEARADGARILATAADWRELGEPECQREEQSAPRPDAAGSSRWPRASNDPLQDARAGELLLRAARGWDAMSEPERLELDRELGGLNPVSVANGLCFGVFANMFSPEEVYPVAAFVSLRSTEAALRSGVVSLPPLDLIGSMPPGASARLFMDANVWTVEGIDDAAELARALMAQGFVWDPAMQEAMDLMEFNDQMEPSGVRAAMARLKEERWLESSCPLGRAQGRPPRV